MSVSAVPGPSAASAIPGSSVVRTVPGPFVITYPVHFSDWDKASLRPVQTSYYTAWLTPWDRIEQCRLEAWSDTRGMREARRLIYGHLPTREGYEILRKHEVECARVAQEFYVLQGWGGDPNVGFSARQIMVFDLVAHADEFLEKHLYKVVAVGLFTVTSLFFCAVRGQRQ